MTKFLLCAVFGFLMIGCATTAKSDEKMAVIMRECEYTSDGVMFIIYEDCILKRLAHYCLNEKDISICENLANRVSDAEKSCINNEVWGCHKLGVLYAKGYGVEQNFFKAFEFYKKACDLNLPNSCYNLAILYKDGQGTKQNFTNAINLYEKACNANHAKSCNNLGFLYDNGQGIKQNKSMAKKYFGKACDLGEQMGCDNYKMLNEKGVK